MVKPQSLFLFVVGRTLGATAFYLLAAGIFYWAIAGNNHTWPQMSQDGLRHWRTACIWFGGFAIVGLLFLILKEALKRRNFDLETVNDKAVVESWPTWLLKKGITYIAVVLMIGGGLFSFPSAGPYVAA